MKELSKAILNSKKSKIRELFDLLLKSGGDAISFGIGQPDFTAPDFVNAGIIKALNEHKTLYAPALGIPPLREVIAKKFQSENNLKWVKKGNIIVTNGGSQALTLAFAVLSNPGDEIILNSPNFISYFYLSDYFMLNCKEVHRNDDYSPNFQKIRNSITSKTKFLVINSPNNPTGYVFSQKDMDELVNIVIENDLYLISDEVYEKFQYNGSFHISPASYDGMKDRTITLNALSKTFGATGLRLGYIAASEEIIKNMEKYIQYTTAGVNHPVQYGAIEALSKIDQLGLPTIINNYDTKRKFCIERLQELGFHVIAPHGAFYIMPKLNPKWGINADQFSQELVKSQHVACVGGNAFGKYSDDCLRISYATSNELLKEGFDRIEKYLKSKNFL